MSSATPFPTLPICNITFPSTPLARAAFAYSEEHSSVQTHHHVVRVAYFALLLAMKMPAYTAIFPDLDLEALVVGSLLHDMGLSTNKTLLSRDTRFEVDGANIARDFIISHGAISPSSCSPSLSPSPCNQKPWDKHRIQLVWDAIALHTTASIAPHKEPEVALVALGTAADFAGPRFPGAVITEDEYREIVGAFPRAGFYGAHFREVACGVCRDKPETTFDNFVSQVGLAYGTDGHGGGKEEFRRKYEAADPVGAVLGQLDYLEQLDKEHGV